VATLEANRLALDENESLVLTTNATLGSGNFTYNYTGLPPGCAGTGPNLTCPLTAQGTFTVGVTVTDSNGWSVKPGALTLTVSPSLTASVTASTMSPTAGESVTFQATGKGGAAGLHYAWAFGDGSTGTDPRPATPTIPGGGSRCRCGSTIPSGVRPRGRST
jgi:PKD repeat protein